MLPEQAFALFDLLEDADKVKLSEALVRRTLQKDEHLLQIGEVSASVYFLHSGAVYQYNLADWEESVIDLHTDGEWFLNAASFIPQTPSAFGIKTYSNCEVYELTVHALHGLISFSPVFFSLGKILAQGRERTLFYDSGLTPAAQYEYLEANRRALFHHFPLKMIASYLKITPETLSRVRAGSRIS